MSTRSLEPNVTSNKLLKRSRDENKKKGARGMPRFEPHSYLVVERGVLYRHSTNIGLEYLSVLSSLGRLYEFSVLNFIYLEIHVLFSCFNAPS
jgi:hypothetical protein